MYIYGRVTLAKKHGKFDLSLGTVEDKDNTYGIINIQKHNSVCLLGKQYIEVEAMLMLMHPYKGWME